MYVQIRVRARRSPSSILIPNSVSRPGDTDQTDTHADLGIYDYTQSKKTLLHTEQGTHSFNVRSAKTQISLRICASAQADHRLRCLPEEALSR